MFSSIYKIILLVAFVCLGVLVTKPYLTHQKLSHQLVVALQSGYPPFEFLDQKGKIVGFDVDLAELIADELGKELVIQDMDFDGEILSLKQGKVDLIISGMNITPSRLKEISMVPYHGEEARSLSLIFWNEIPQGIHLLDDFSKQTHQAISVESGTVPEMFMSRYQNIEVKAFQGALAPLMDVKYGRSAANLVEPDVAQYLKRQHPEIKILEVPLNKEEAIFGFGIGVGKQNPELYQQIQQIVDKLKVSGKLEKLEEKWFKGGV